MFEKEAEEYTIENVCSTCYFEKPCENKCEAFGCADSKTYVLKAFKDGAEFGYNKAKEEMQAQGLALQSDMDKTIEQNIQLKKQIEKLEKLVPKTCENCVGYGCHAICVDCDFKDKWEIKEK